jgi:hypothetical protein
MVELQQEERQMALAVQTPGYPQVARPLDQRSTQLPAQGLRVESTQQTEAAVEVVAEEESLVTVMLS